MSTGVKPNASPLAMLKVSGTVMMVRNDGKATTGFDHSISPTCAIISDPTTISAGAVAAAGIALMRPPATTPAALSM